MKFFAICLALFCLPVFAVITGWRMDGSGHFPMATPQTQWSTTERVIWATDLPKWSNASPVLAGGRLFVTAEPDLLICLDRDGKILWQHGNGYDQMLTAEEKTRLAAEEQACVPIQQKINELQRTFRGKRGALNTAEKEAKAAPDNAALKEQVATLQAEIVTLQGQLTEQQKALAAFTLAQQWRMPITHEVNGYSSDTPVSDGTRVYATFGTGVTACYTLDGTRQWIRMIEKPTHGWGHSASPVLVGDTLIVQYIDTFGLDARTGNIRWRAKHPHIWGTPAVIRLGNYQAILTDCGEIINTMDGATLATTGMQLEFGSPLISDNIAYCVSGKTARAFTLALKDNAVTATQLWEAAVDNDRYYASPLLHDGLLYLINQRGTLSVLDAATGALAYTQRMGLGGTCYPSPVLAGNVILLGSDNGKSVVITPGREYKEVSRPTLEPFMSTPICDGSRMYIRTRGRQTGKLFCIGE